jgi:hypothetical protein
VNGKSSATKRKKFSLSSNNLVAPKQKRTGQKMKSKIKGVLRMSVMIHGNAEWGELELFFEEEFPECFPEESQVFHVLNTLYSWEQISYNERYNETSEIWRYKSHRNPDLEKLTPIGVLKRLDSISYQIESDTFYPISRLFINTIKEKIEAKFSIDTTSKEFKIAYDSESTW